MKLAKKLLGAFVEFEELEPSLIPEQYETKETVLFNKEKINPDDLKKFEDHFDELFEQADLPGPDYKEYSDSLAELDDLKDELKFSTAFKVLKSMGLKKDVLLSSIDHYKKIIEDDKKGFINAIENKSNIDIEQTTKEIESLENNIKSFQFRLDESKMKLIDAKEKLENLKNSTAKNNYINVCNVITSQLDDHKNKIKTYVN